MADKPLQLISGRLTQVEGTVTSAGAANAGDIVALDAAGLLDLSVMPTGVGPDTRSVVTSESLSAGDMVNIYNNGGTATARKADNTSSGKEACGFVLSSVISPNEALVYFEGVVTGLTSLTPGARYYAGTTPGAITATPPSSSGNVVQYVGVAISATELSFEASDGVVLA